MEERRDREKLNREVSFTYLKWVFSSASCVLGVNSLERLTVIVQFGEL